MVADKHRRHRNKPKRVSDAETMVILLLFHWGGRCFKHFYKEYVCKRLSRLFPRRVSYKRFVEQRKEVLFPLTIFIKKVLPGAVSVRWVGSSGLIFTWSSMTNGRY